MVHSRFAEDKEIVDLFLSEEGIRALSSRLKQAIGLYKELGLYAKRSASSKELYARELIRGVRGLHDTLTKLDASFMYSMDYMNKTVTMDELRKDALQLLQDKFLEIGEEISEEAKRLERLRKTVKEAAIYEEKQLIASKNDLDKTLQKYHSLEAELENFQNNPNANSKLSFSFRSKSEATTAKHEDELKQRVVDAKKDLTNKQLDYENKKLELETKLRPKFVTSFIDLVQETDAACFLQAKKLRHLDEDMAISFIMLFEQVVPAHNYNQAFNSFIQHWKSSKSMQSTMKDLSISASTGVVPPIAPPSQPKSSILGQPLEDLMPKDSCDAPAILLKLFAIVEQYGLNVEGIYRLSGSPVFINKVLSLLETYGENFSSHMESSELEANIASIASLIKQYIRELPTPLISLSQAELNILSNKNADIYTIRNAIHECVNNLPDAAYVTLRRLIIHLSQIVKHESENKMHASNLSIVWGPTIMSKYAELSQMGSYCRVIEVLIENCSIIFDETAF